MVGRVLLPKFFFLSVILIIESVSYSQPITWQRIYGGPYSDMAYDVCKSNDGYFFAVGTTASSLWALKINIFGDTIWTKQIPGPLALAVAATNDGGCVITGGKIHLLLSN